MVIDCAPEELPAVAVIAETCFSRLPIPVICNNDIGNLRVPEELQLPNGKYRYPLHGEVEIGLNYGDEVDYDPEEYKTFKSPQGYCTYKMKLKQAKDKADTYRDSDPQKAQEALAEQEYIKTQKAVFQQV